MPKPEKHIVEVNGREVSISNPNKVLFPEAGYTKLDLVNYYLAVADGALRGAGGRPNVLVRYPNGIAEEFSHAACGSGFRTRMGNQISYSTIFQYESLRITLPSRNV